MMNKQVVIFTGLALAAVVAVAGVTKNQWMPQHPETAATEAVTTSGQATSQEPVKEQKLATAEQGTVAEQPAAETNTATGTETAVAPSFDTVRVEKTGEALIAGRAQPGSEVTVMLDGKVIGKTTANADGAFVLTPDAPLPGGSGALTIESKTDGGTATLKSEQSVAVIVPEEEKKQTVVAVVSADEPTKILQKSESATVDESPATTEVTAAIPLSLDAVDYDESGNIVFSGSGQPGSTVRLYVDNAVAGEARAGEDGRWSFAGSSPIPAGKHMLRVDGVDTAGTVLSRVELPFFREEPTKVASAATGQTVEPAATAETSTTATGTTTTSETTTEQTVASAAATTTTEAAKPKDGRIVIQPGNNLWRISRVIYGSGTKYTVIFESNKDQIRDPDLIFPGQVFMTPDVVPPETIDPARRDSLKPEEGGSTG